MEAGMEMSTSTVASLRHDLYRGCDRRQREVVRCLGERLKSTSEWNDDTEQVCKTLIEYYLISPSKSTVKPFSLSMLDMCNQEILSTVIDTFVFSLKDKFDEGMLSLRRNLCDSICRLIDVKRISGVILTSVDGILKYLLWCIVSTNEESMSTEDSVKFNDLMTDMKVAVHTVNKLLQKVDVRDYDQSVMQTLIGTCMGVIKRENALLDCQTSCAMTLPLVYRILHGEKSSSILLSDLFDNRDSELLVDGHSMHVYLCTLTGLVGGMSASELLKEHNGTTVLCVACEKVFDACDRIKEGTQLKFALSRCLVVLTSKMMTCVQSCLPRFDLMQKRLLQFVYDYLEDPVDAIRHQAKNVFEHVIKMHMKVHGDSSRLMDLTKDILSMDWHKKGKYGLLSVLSSLIETTVFLELCPNLPSLILSALDEMGMCNYAADLYEKLMLKHRAHVSAENWHEIWLDPVVRSLSNPCLRKGVIEYILPKVLQASKFGLKFIIPSLISCQICTDSLLVLVTCLKRARCLGYIPQVEKTQLWNDILPFQHLKQALEHREANLRIEAFGLLCFNPKTTERIPEIDLKLTNEFILNNLTNQSPAARQDIVSALRKLMIRIKESWIVAEKNKADNKLVYYRDFITSFFRELVQNIYPGVSFTRRTTALNLLEATVSILSPVVTLPSLDTVVSPSHAHNLLLMLTDTFEENKSSALNLLLLINPAKLQLNSGDKIREMVAISEDLVKTTRPQDCTTAAFLHKLLIQQTELLTAVDSQSENIVENRQEILLKRLVVELRRQVDIAEKNLIHGSVQAPMYPVIHCIRYLLKDVDFKGLNFQENWRNVLNELVEMCFRASTVVSPVVSHASPEGNVPVHDLIGGEYGDVSLSTVQDMPEFLVVCSWRTIKEVSLLLGDLSSWPIHSESSPGFIPESTMLKIGIFFTDLLLESRHRGAFELAYSGFQPLCSMLWSSKLEKFNSLPQVWLQKLISDIEKSDSEESRLCATRRSAGVPFYTLALVVAEPASRGRKSLGFVMESLLTIAEKHHIIGQIHSLNTLRALYKDNRLSEAVHTYVSQGMKIAVLGFSAENWAVRNASTLLFSALMVRIFGVRRDKNIISSKNSLSGRIFFYRYPALFPFLLERINECTENIQTLNPGLYPILMILGRLTPSILEGTDTAMNVAEFLPFVLRCAASPVLKTREMGARALSPIVFKDQFQPIISDICERLEGSQSTNLTHGLLLQLHGLLLDAISRQLDLSSDVLRAIYKCNRLMGRQNRCYMTRAAYVQVLGCIIGLMEESRFKSRVMGDALVIIHQETAGVSPLNAVYYTQFMIELLSLYISFCREFDEGRLLYFLTGHRIHEVRNLALSFLLKNPHLRFKDLSPRLAKETHPTCLALLLDLLPTSTKISCHLTASSYHVVKCARLRHLTTSNYLNENPSDVITSLMESSKPEQVFEIRLTASQVLLNLCDEFKRKSGYQIELWSVLIRLLLDDDEEVRAAGGDVVVRLSCTNNDIALCDSVVLSTAIDLMMKYLTPEDCMSTLINILCGPEKVENIKERLFDRGESSTYEDRIHSILLILDKFDSYCQNVKFTSCEKLVVNHMKTISIDLQNCLQNFDTSLGYQFLSTSVFTEIFCHIFGQFCALFILDKVRNLLKIPESEQNFECLKSMIMSCFTPSVWPLSRFSQLE